MKRVSLFLLAFLIVTLFLSLYQIPKVKAQESNDSFGNPSVPDIAFVNWTRFWSLFNAHSDWDLEYNEGVGWNSIKSDLQIIKNYTQEWLCKITLNFTASYNADYRLTFGIDLDVKNYTHKTDSWNYTISYKNYTVVFDWSDIKDLPLDYIGHGVKPVGDESYFWFRIRKNNVAQGKNVVIDPSFGYTTILGSGQSIEDYIFGVGASCPESGTADSITIALSGWSNGEKVKCALYDANKDFVAETEARTTGGSGWQTFDFSAPKPSLTAQDYWIVAFSNKPVSAYYDAVASWTIITLTQTFEGGFPSSLSSGTEYDGYACSIFCNYTTGGLQEYTEEFSETVSISASLNRWQALFYTQTETTTITTTSYSWKEKACFYTETTTTTEQHYKWIELNRFFIETIVVTESSSFAMEIMMAFVEFTETINVDASLFLRKAKQFITQETVTTIANFYKWISLSRFFTETIQPSETTQSLIEKLFSVTESIGISASLEALKEVLVTFIEFSELIQFDAIMYLTLPTAIVEAINMPLILAAFAVIISFVAISLVSTATMKSEEEE